MPVAGAHLPRVGEIAIFHLTRIHAEGFKALDPVDMRIPEKLLFLIGSNGAGKSSTLQALAFIQFFAIGKPAEFITERGWNRLEVRSKTIEKSHNTFRYHLLFEDEHRTLLLWQFNWGVISESVLNEQMWIWKSGSTPKRLFYYNKKEFLETETGERISGLMSTGSIINIIEPSRLTSEHSALSAAIDWCARITSLELLSPVAMRGNARGTPKGIGIRGQRLSGFLATLDGKTKSRIVDRLSDFYPLQGLNTTKKKAGWIDLKISESFSIGPISAQHMSDGFMRLLALCAIPEFGSRSSLVLLDEIEDGIEPHILPRLIERIVKDSSAQFIMTSHSPLLINFFEPENVVLVSRAEDGRSIFAPIADLGVVKSGREFLGPGEIWANAGLSTLNEQAADAHRHSKGKSEDTTGKFSREWALQFMGYT